jgi:hypothetical protein
MMVATSRRAAAVVAMTSGLVEVATTARCVKKILGIIRDDVFPERDGPKASTLRCDPAKAA